MPLRVLGSAAGEFRDVLRAATASPIWSCQVVEVPDLESPIVLDPLTVAEVFYGNATLKVDESSELDKNLVRLELSFEALCNVRQVVGGAYVIAKAGA
jgi:hypothetical protein